MLVPTARVAPTSWLRDARLLAKLENVDPRSKEIVIVCDRPYDNVPDYVLWRAPLRHAVGYSTGETGLISPAEFARLDLRGFVDVRDGLPGPEACGDAED